MKKKFVFMIVALLFSNAWLMAQKDSIVALPTITVTATTQVSEKLNDAFFKAFPDAINVNWYKLDKDYLAKFIENDMEHNSLFKKNGWMKYDVSFGYAENLPEEHRRMVENAYPDHKIIRAFRVLEEGRDIWVVNLEGTNNYVIARVENSELEEVQRFNKS
ncbi:MAG TPA: hypothetical protein VLS85_08135 [Hanamia sp.]|nr:hypothetical protein [Hanamia sp.]